MKEHIRQEFSQYKIHQMQLDPFGFCNAKCWFCPVKYRGNPKHAQDTMSVDLLDKILRNLIRERDLPNGLVSKSFHGFYTAHYNEILLYKHFEDLLRICQELGLCFMVLSNGVPLTPEKVDLMLKYSGVVNGICLNIPAFEAEVWAKRSGMNARLFDKLLSNIRYAMSKLPHMVNNRAMSIQINGVNQHSFLENGGWITPGPEFPQDIDLDSGSGELVQQERLARQIFPGLQIFSVPSLIDRAGTLDHIMTNKKAIVHWLQKGDASRQVTGCGNGREVGGRPVGWIHINSLGQTFLCCNDYDMEVVIGDFRNQELADFWGKEDHIEKIEQSYKTICRECASALF